MWTAGRVAELCGAVCEGDPERILTGVASLGSATQSDLSFCSGGRWLDALPGTNAGALLVPLGVEVPEGAVALRAKDPRRAYAKAAAAMLPLHWPEPGVHPTAIVSPSAVVEGATIGAYAVIEANAVVGAGSWVMAHAYIGEGVVTGESCRVMPHAVVMERCQLGDRVWLQPGAVIGADGFGHVPDPSGPIRVPQLGIAVLESDVEVGANACVDRAALDETRIGRGSRLDNLVQVAHGVRMGAGCLLAAFAGVAGGARLGDGVIMAGRTAVIDGIDVGDGAIFAGLASARKNVPAGARLGGSPARRYSQWLREIAATRRLPELIRQVDKLERRTQRLEEAP